MKILKIALIVTQIIVIIQIVINIQQTQQISELNKKVACLEQGRIYVGDGFCANK